MDANGAVCDATNTACGGEHRGGLHRGRAEPDRGRGALEDPTVFPTPVAGTEGPDWIQIGTEGGFLPAPVVIPAQPTTWVNDPTVFNAGNVDQHSLLVGAGRAADVVVDFSQYAGQTLILYNDAPAAFPARDPRYDYYTGNGGLRDTGGAPSTLPGYGPNTRTVMQIKVSADDGACRAVRPGRARERVRAPGRAVAGVFETGQNPIIVGQGAYNSRLRHHVPDQRLRRTVSCRSTTRR